MAQFDGVALQDSESRSFVMVRVNNEDNELGAAQGKEIINTRVPNMGLLDLASTACKLGSSSCSGVLTRQ